MREFFTADEHHYHENIIGYCGRPYPKGTSQMAASIIGRHNKVVEPGDLVYHLGDFMWISFKGQDHTKVARLLRKMNGRHILILGNHDDLKPDLYVRSGFESVHTSLHLPKGVDGREFDFYLIHDSAAHCAIPDDHYLLHGHNHTLWKHLLDRGKKAINVGVDVWDRTPVSMDQIVELIKRYEQPTSTSTTEQADDRQEEDSASSNEEEEHPSEPS